MIAANDHNAAPAEGSADLDSGPHGRERARLCVATRTVRPVDDLIRFVIGPNGEAVPDVKSKLPGRGVWVTATRGALDEAVKRKAFARGFKRDVRLPADVVDRTERLLERAVVDALAMAGKSGLVAAGFAKTEAALSRGEAVAILHAAEAAPDGVRKLKAGLGRQPPGGTIAVVGFLTSAQLDLALNRTNVVHAALLAGPATETFLARCRRLERFQTGDQHNQADKAGPGDSRPET
jgi:predicted RNA-binding protein YlxR (DUF448 family)